MSSTRFRGTASASQRDAQLARQEQLQRQLGEQRAQEEEQRKRRRRTTIIVVVIVVIVIVVAIAVAVWFFLLRPSGTTGGGGGGTGGGSQGQDLGGSCQDTSQCKSGLICSAAKCTNPPQSTCTTANTCPNGYTCAGAKCLGLKGATCSNDHDCSSQFACTNQTCVNRTCTLNTDCPGSGVNAQACSGGVCVGGHLDGCTDQTGCNFRFVCAAGECSGMLDDPCATTADCQTPFVCTNNKCAIQPCSTVSDCTHVQFGVEFGHPRCDPGIGCTNAVDTDCFEQQQCGDPTLALCENPLGFPHRCGGRGGMPCPAFFGETACLSTLQCDLDPVSNDNACTCNVDADCIPSKPHCRLTGTPDLHSYCSAT